VLVTTAVTLYLISSSFMTAVCYLPLTMGRGRLIVMKFLLVTLALIAILVLAKGGSSKRGK